MPTLRTTRRSRITRTVRGTLHVAIVASIAALGVSTSAVAQTCQPTWEPPDPGQDVGNPGVNSSVAGLTVFDDGTGPALYVAGNFTAAGGVSVNHIAKWDGSSWSPLGSGMNAIVGSLAVFDDGTGPALYAGGSFPSAGGVPVNNIAKWDGSSWSPLGSGIVGGGPGALTVFDDGTGPALYVGGNFTVAGGTQALSIAKWDGSSWSPLGSGMNAPVNALAVFDDGTGSALYAGGFFTNAGGTPANKIGRWNGATWSPLGSGVNNGNNTAQVFALTVFDDGTGPALYVGGGFTTAGGVSASNIAKWDGSSWGPLAGGITGIIAIVDALTVFDDGAGPALYVGGRFSMAGGVLVNNIAKWDGSSWGPLATGITGNNNAFVGPLAVFDDGTGPALFAGGFFTTAGGFPASHIARYAGCPSSSADLNGDGVVDGADLAQLLTQWGTNGAADLNGDGVVNGADLATLLTNWGVLP